MRKVLIAVFLILVVCFAVSAQSVAENKDIKVLLFPKFEVGDMAGDAPGEAQFYYEAYFDGAKSYSLKDGSTLYVKDNMAMCVTGPGKVSAATAVMAVLTDPRFDFSNALIISTGCAGSAPETTVMGDVFIATAAVDFDLGHHADPREMTTDSITTWFHNSDYDDTAYVILSSSLTDKAFELVKDVEVQTTPLTLKYMASGFENASWALRKPMVMKGTVCSGDNFFKGEYDLANAHLIVKTYNCPDSLVAGEMEDVAIGIVLKRLGLLDHYLIIRGSVNMLVFMNGATPENSWSEGIAFFSEDNTELSDIFNTAMENNFKVGRVIINAFLDGTLTF